MNLHVIADTLSIITITICFILKVPQILNLLAVKSAKGMSILGLMLELTSYTVTTCYNYTNGYSLLSYLEYPIILIQEYILIYLVLKYLKMINKLTIAIASCYFVVGTCILVGIIPKVILTFLTPMGTPISASSKIVQLLAIVRSKNSESVSILTWFISAFTNMTRIFTIWVDSADLLLLGNFIISTVLSLSVMLSAVYYKPSKKRI
ncbi:hypothetical protein G9C98_005251 [Cotesia typhae]|uniref:Solute carrier family 66 member 3 n=2 Tax=Cotesia TaxID=32390 RepID=A0A8J5UU71_9HYME|nr:solute carrier family 66 member 3-like [Cotesia glomerata]KAG8042617.1 hypothetical protein G9C98_005251 [Cotesia typhae]KAH0556585.1 hypothetical protein KQX54_001210 [Cotesia glomerata]